MLCASKICCPTRRDAVAYIMDIFPIVRRKDEANYNGDYRTKRIILEIYDTTQKAIRIGRPCQTRRDPPHLIRAAAIRQNRPKWHKREPKLDDGSKYDKTRRVEAGVSSWPPDS